MGDQKYEQVPIQRCRSCEGTWVTSDSLYRIIESHEEKFDPALIRETLGACFTGLPEKERKRVLSCPKCAQAMVARNYEYSSGVVIDVCQKCHGVWLDRDELARAQIVHEHGADEEKKHAGEYAAIASAAKAEVDTELAEAYHEGVQEGRDATVHPFHHFLGSLHNALKKKNEP